MNPHSPNSQNGKQICIIGYGSLLDESSARRTAPSLTRFELGYVEGYRRIFNKVGMAFFKLYPDQCLDTKRLGCCATRQDPNSRIGVCAFDVSEAEFAAIYQREHRYRWIEVEFSGPSGKRLGRMCTEYNDFDYRLNKCATESEYQQQVGQYYQGKIWRDDILPFPTYLHHCLTAAEKASEVMGEAFYRNFLESSFVADNQTSIADLLKAEPDYLAQAQAYTNA